MKKLVYISSLFLLQACIFSYDPPRGLLYVHNDSYEDVYVYLKCGNADSLPLFPKLELSVYVDANMEDAYGNPVKPVYTYPDYRINAYDVGGMHIWGTRNKPRLPCDENEITLFFITEKTMRDCDWNEIYRNQMFEKRIVLTKEYLENRNWKYTYLQSDTTIIHLKD